MIKILNIFLCGWFLLSSAPSLVGADDSDDLFMKKTDEALAVKVLASDRLVLEDGRHIKLIGIGSLGPPPPKPVKYDDKGHMIPQPEEPTISLQEQAISYAQDLMEGKKVKLEFDVDAGDTASGYLYAYVFLPDGRMANTELLRMGFVKLDIVLPNIKYEQQLDLAYQEAKKEKRGLEGD